MIRMLLTSKVWQVTALVIASFCISVLCNLHTIAEYRAYGAYTPFVAMELDEHFYTWAAQRTFEYYFLSQDSFSDDPFPRYPHNLVDLCIGAILYYTHLDSNLLLIIFDIFSCSLGFVLVFALFRVLDVAPRDAFIAALVLAYTPWALCLRTFIGSGIPISDSLVVSPLGPIGAFRSISPFGRSFHTQLSQCWFYLVLCGLYVYCNVPARRTILYSILLGALTGFSLYLYTYCWIILAVLCPLILMSVLFEKHKGWKPELCRYLLFLISFLVVSAPGLYMISRSVLQMDLAFAPDVPRIWFLPLSSASALVLSFLVLKCYAKDKAKMVQSLALLAGLLFVTECIVINIQPAIRKFMFPYHFDIYFVPLITGITVPLLMVFVDSFKSRLLTLVVSVGLVGTLITYIPKPLSVDAEDDMVSLREASLALATYVKPKDKVLTSRDSYDVFTNIAGILYLRPVVPVYAHFLRPDLIPQVRLVYAILGDDASVGQRVSLVAGGRIPSEYYYVTPAISKYPLNFLTISVQFSPNTPHPLTKDFMQSLDITWYFACRRLFGRSLVVPSLIETLPRVWQSSNGSCALYRWVPELNEFLYQRANPHLSGYPKKSS